MFKMDRPRFITLAWTVLVLLALVLTACSTPLATSTFTVTYDANGGLGTVPSASEAFPPLGTITVADEGDLTRTGYLFTSWGTQADGSGITYSAGSTLTLTGEDVTLYAQWESQPAIAAGGLHTLALTSDGEVYRWGIGSGGDLGVPYLVNAP